ncbi:hypothetical protein RHOFW104T7_10750 [Rhodanobacter thiooxydans]|uniref:ORC1/DEAH AAA+ ATPase domain-containing protein n=2 Tax=Rhodanobacter thiooxydans TaxID=416169 RepID=A0A154QIK7_9GAMM|nr:hypothetical protein RHOFW104T7_10750 [Rhodanobacter thiooxydans]
MRSRLVTHMIEAVASLEDQRIILVVDEAHDLSRMEYKLLINLSNELEEGGVRLMVLLIGQPELRQRMELFKSTKQRHILGRFMLDSFCFRGIETAEELRHVFSQYDSKVFYPEDSRTSYTEAYSGTDFNRGFRLADQAEITWRVMSVMRNEAGIKSEMSIPMQSITSFANYALLHFAGTLNGALLLTEDQVSEALTQTGFLLLEY